jgi:peptide subunit release factor RF-3
MTFLRVCSGRFEKDMLVQHPRLGRKVRMVRPHRLVARDRETVDEAYADEVVQARLSTEYGVQTDVERMGAVSARWISGNPQEIATIRWTSRSTIRAGSGRAAGGGGRLGLGSRLLRTRELSDPF